jgi:hypothetical protein
LRIPAGKDALVAVGEREVRLTNLDKPFWPRSASPSATCSSTTPTSRPSSCLTSPTARW